MERQTYRPFSDWPLQTPVLHALYQGLVDQHIPHAILFGGAVSTTRMFAEFFAKTLLCTGEDAPCNACPSCHQMDAGNHPDFLHISGEDGGSVKAAQIENAQARLKLVGHGQGRTVYLIEGMDKLTPVAANRLLKTLEEPVSRAVALLTAENDGRVLSTIRSRAFLYRLGTGEAVWDDPLPDSLLKNQTGTEEALEAVNSGEQNLSFAGLLNPVIQWTEAAIVKRQPSLKLAQDLLKETEAYKMEDVLHVLIVWLRDLLHYQLDERDSLVCQDFIKTMSTQAKAVDTGRLLGIIDVVMETKRRISSHVIARLNIEQMCIRIREVIRSV